MSSQKFSSNFRKSLIQACGVMSLAQKLDRSFGLICQSGLSCSKGFNLTKSLAEDALSFAVVTKSILILRKLLRFFFLAKITDIFAYHMFELLMSR